MKLIPNWRKHITHAYSTWALMAAAGVEGVVNTVGVDWLPIAPAWRAALVLVMLALVKLVQLLPQRSLGDEPNP